MHAKENQNMATNSAPEGRHTVTPYLVVTDVDRLIAFATEAFDATLQYRIARPDGSVMHALIHIGDSTIMTGEPLGEFDRVSAFLHLYVEDCEAVYRRALAAGAESITKPADQFYGDRSCEVRDPLGNLWLIATRIENLPSEEIERRAATRTIYRLCEPAGYVLAPPSTRTDVAQDVNRSPAAISDGLPVSVLREEGIATGPIENML
jgi:PhnB protein